VKFNGNEYTAIVLGDGYCGNGATIWQGSVKEIAFLRDGQEIFKANVGCGGNIPLAESRLLHLKAGEEIPQDMISIVVDNTGNINMWVGSTYFKIN
jgi:hypothetical protein